MAGSKKAARVRKLFKPSEPGFPVADDPEEHPAATPRRFPRRDIPPRCPLSTNVLASSELHALEVLPYHKSAAFRRLVPQPTADPSVPSYPPHTPEDTSPTRPQMGRYLCSI
jgi:hypothetical protein